MKAIILICISLTLIFPVSCTKKLIIPASYDAALFSDLPDVNISGKRLINNERGFGTVTKCYGASLTYPVLYLGSGEQDSVKDAFVLGGFELEKMQGTLEKAFLKLYVHYTSFSRKKIIFFVRPLNGLWDEDSITYLDVYETALAGAELTALAEHDESKCLLVHFDLEARPRDYKSCYKLPNTRGITLTIDITKIVKSWLEHPGSNYGLLIDPMWKNDIRYCTTNPLNELTSFGVVEIAAAEWFTWDGTIPAGQEFNQPKILNNARGNLKFVPRLELRYR